MSRMLLRRHSNAGCVRLICIATEEESEDDCRMVKKSVAGQEQQDVEENISAKHRRRQQLEEQEWLNTTLPALGARNTDPRHSTQKLEARSCSNANSNKVTDK